MRSDRALVVLSDIHAGSTRGMLHDDGVPLDDGQWVYPWKAQAWLNHMHDLFVHDVEDIVSGLPAHLCLLGDMTEGVHHNTHQIISSDKGVHIQAVFDVLERGILRLPFESIHMVRGTPAHVDRAGGLEKSLATKMRAAKLPIVKDPITNSYVFPVLQMELHDVLFDLKHHGRMSGREHLRKGYAGHYGFDIWASYTLDKRRPPAVAIRAHNHRFMDSGPDHRGVTRVIGTPCWQLPTEWVRRISIETQPDIGGLVVLVSKNGRLEVTPLLYAPPDEDEPWRPDEDDSEGAASSSA